jgi:hypothetical protein
MRCTDRSTMCLQFGRETRKRTKAHGGGHAGTVVFRISARSRLHLKRRRGGLAYDQCSWVTQGLSSSFKVSKAARRKRWNAPFLCQKCWMPAFCVTHTHARARTHKHTCTHARTHARTQRHTHTHTHTHAHSKAPTILDIIPLSNVEAPTGGMLRG